MINLDCQLYCVKNHLGDVLLGGSVRAFSKRLKVRSCQYLPWMLAAAFHEIQFWTEEMGEGGTERG